MKLKKWLCPLILTELTLLLIFLLFPDGALWGSNVDWLSQHINIAEHLRQLIWEKGTLLPEFTPLGAGANGFQLAYYGFLRPDILLACLLPGISVKTILIVYAVGGMLVSVNLCYFWLKRQGFDTFFCFLGGFFLACATCFFQTHRQLMFVNYMPFLFLALMAIDSYRKRPRKLWLTLSIFLILIHSFYFSIACLAVCFLYMLYRMREKKEIVDFILSAALAIGLAAALLIPTAFVLLSNAKDAGNSAGQELWWLVDPSLHSLLYHPYGCGVTVICLYTLFASVRKKETRLLAITIFICFFANICSYLLNGTLYVRGKILIPFLPLIIMLCVKELESLYHRESRVSLIAAGLCLPVLMSYVIGFRQNILVWADAAMLFVFLILSYKRSRLYFNLLLCLIPPLLCIQANKREEFVSIEQLTDDPFTEEDYKALYQDKNYRFETYTTPYACANYTPVAGMKRSAMYSSTMNQGFSRFFYDIMKNPISIRNRTALLPGPNPFFEYLMGTRYLETPRDQLPMGYKIRSEKKDIVLAENTSVLPGAYVSYRTMSEEAFDSLSFPENLEAVTGSTIVKDNEAGSDFSSALKEADITEMLSPTEGSFPVDGLIKKTKEGYQISAKEDTTAEFVLKEPLKEQLAILSFDVESPKGREFAITINGTRNKLSGKKAPYPNGNKTFTYILSSPEPIKKLNVLFTKGNYNIRNVKIWLLDAADFPRRDITEAAMKPTAKHEVLNCSVTAESDGCFVTSLPVQKGYTVLVDGKETKPQAVDKTFIGFPIKAGKHDVRITFRAPGKRIGLCISAIACLFFLLLLYGERKYFYKRSKLL